MINIIGNGGDEDYQNHSIPTIRDRIEYLVDTVELPLKYLG